jgi:ATP/maltotriose-dependent transcriptional regulator MalT
LGLTLGLVRGKRKAADEARELHRKAAECFEEAKYHEAAISYTSAWCRSKAVLHYRLSQGVETALRLLRTHHDTFGAEVKEETYQWAKVLYCQREQIK